MTNPLTTSGLPIAPAHVTAPRVRMRFAELVIGYSSPDGGTRFELPPEYEEFRVGDDVPADFDVEWRIGRFAVPPGAPDLGTEVWDHWRLGAGEDAMVFYRTRERRPWAMIRADWARQRATVVQDAEALGSAVADIGTYPLSEILATRLLTRTGAANLHASAAVFDGRAHLFVGHSGAGKTTISEIAIGEGAAVLSDDRTIVAVREGRGIAWGTPWHGTGRRSSSRTAPIGGLFLLQQASKESAVRLKPARAVKELFVRLINPRLTVDEADAALRTAEAVGATVPMWELSFRPVPEAFHLAVDLAAQASR